MKQHSLTINRKNLILELKAASKMAAEAEKEIKDSSETQNMSLQNMYDSAMGERDLKSQVQIHQLAAAKIEELKKTIHALDSGSYGTCCDCGNHIEEKRLAAKPEVITCISCQTDRERISQIEKQKIKSTPGLQNAYSWRYAA